MTTLGVSELYEKSAMCALVCAFLDFLQLFDGEYSASARLVSLRFVFCGGL